MKVVECRVREERQVDGRALAEMHSDHLLFESRVTGDEERRGRGWGRGEYIKIIGTMGG